MKKFKISNDEVAGLSNAPRYEFPKYVTQVINLVNSNAGGTRPKVVGQMSELIKEFDGRSVDEWIEWYTERYPDAVSDATKKIWDMYETMKPAFNAITKEIVENWVKDLVLWKNILWTQIPDRDYFCNCFSNGKGMEGGKSRRRSSGN